MSEALREKVAFVPGAPFFPGEPEIETMRLNFSNRPPALIAEGLARLGAVVRRHMSEAAAAAGAESHRMLLLFLLGAVLGPALDHLHVASGTTSYAHPVFWQAAWWTPLLFGFAAAGFADLHTRLRTLFRGYLRPRPALAAVDLALFTAADWASASLPLPNAALLAR